MRSLSLSVHDETRGEFQDRGGESRAIGDGGGGGGTQSWMAPLSAMIGDTGLSIQFRAHDAVDGHRDKALIQLCGVCV